MVDIDKSPSAEPSLSFDRSTTERGRPQSMFVGNNTFRGIGDNLKTENSIPPTTAPSSISSSGQQARNQVVDNPKLERPAVHIRRSSINDIVSRFERMGTPPGSPARSPVLGDRKDSYTMTTTTVNVPEFSGKNKLPPPMIGNKPVGLRNAKTPDSDAINYRKDTSRAEIQSSSEPSRTEGNGTEAPKRAVNSLIAQWNQAGQGSGSSSTGGGAGLKRAGTVIGNGRRL